MEIAKITQSSPNNHLHSTRMEYSHHIRPVPQDESISSLMERFLESRYYDYCINNYTENNRHRMKDVVTLELRIFDSVGSKHHLKSLLQSVKFISEKIKSNYIKSVSPTIIRFMRDVLPHKVWFYNVISDFHLSSIAEASEFQFIYPWLSEVGLEIRDALDYSFFKS